MLYLRYICSIAIVALLVSGCQSPKEREQRATISRLTLSDYEAIGYAAADMVCNNVRGTPPIIARLNPAWVQTSETGMQIEMMIGEFSDHFGITVSREPALPFFWMVSHYDTRGETKIVASVIVTPAVSPWMTQEVDYAALKTSLVCWTEYCKSSSNRFSPAFMRELRLTDTPESRHTLLNMAQTYRKCGLRRPDPRHAFHGAFPMEMVLTLYELERWAEDDEVFAFAESLVNDSAFDPEPPRFALPYALRLLETGKLKRAGVINPYDIATNIIMQRYTMGTNANMWIERSQASSMMLSKLPVNVLSSIQASAQIEYDGVKKELDTVMAQVRAAKNLDPALDQKRLMLERELRRLSYSTMLKKYL